MRHIAAVAVDVDVVVFAVDDVIVVCFAVLHVSVGV